MNCMNIGEGFPYFLKSPNNFLSNRKDVVYLIYFIQANKSSIGRGKNNLSGPMYF